VRNQELVQAFASVVSRDGDENGEWFRHSLRRILQGSLVKWFGTG
jgi:hypothetical protein